VQGVPVTIEQPGGRRVSLPPYPFERTYHWIDPAPESAPQPKAAARRGPLDMSRWCSVPVWKQLPPAPPSTVDGVILLVAEGDVAAQLAARLGPHVAVVTPPGDREGYQTILKTFEGNRIVHAACLSGRHPFFDLFALAQALVDRTEPVHVDVLTAGALGVVGDDLSHPQRAMVAGVSKVLPLEAPQVSVRHIDLRHDTELAAAAAEIAVAPGREHGETVALRAGRRWVPETAEVPMPPETPPSIRDNGVYLITGGLGGIGITLAEDLGVRHRARVVLVSRSLSNPERGERARAAAARIEAAGGEVLPVAADITDPARLREVREQILARWGRLDGIVHAAGLPGGGLIEVRERAAAEAVLAPKVLGTQALAEVFGDLDLDFVALCGSVTGVIGGLGQVDYTAANAFLDAYAHSGKGFRGRVVSIDWGGWLEVGMAVETAAPEILRHAPANPFDHPVLTKRMDGNVFGGTISPATHWLLAEHKVGGVPVAPGTSHLELARAAVAAALPAPSPEAVVELRDVTFLTPLAVPEGGTAEVRVRLEPADDGVDFAITAGEVTHVRGNGGWVLAAASRVDLAELQTRCTPMEEVSYSGADRQGLVSFGPRWQSLRAIWQDKSEGLARLEAVGDVAAELDRWVLHPAMLDEATSFTTPADGESRLPLGYGRITIHRRLPTRFWVHADIRVTPAGDALDLRLIDDDGRLLADIADFVLRRVDADTMRGNLSQSPPGRAAPAAEQPGIRPEQGAEVFRRLLAAELGPQVVVNVRSVAESLAGVREVTTSAVAATSVGAGWTKAIERTGEFAAPQTELEALLAEIWSEVLGVTGIARDDDFFDLGGNSLVAVQLVARIRNATQVKLPMRSLFEAPSVAAMAELVEGLRAEQPAPATATSSAAAGLTIPLVPRPS
jgi:phthiocerol/phenolphthiocerol synthesis type-I polyketide synthase E